MYSRNNSIQKKIYKKPYYYDNKKPIVFLNLKKEKRLKIKIRKRKTIINK